MKTASRMTVADLKAKIETAHAELAKIRTEMDVWEFEAQIRFKRLLGDALAGLESRWTEGQIRIGEYMGKIRYGVIRARLVVKELEAWQTRLRRRRRVPSAS